MCGVFTGPRQVQPPPAQGLEPRCEPPAEGPGGDGAVHRFRLKGADRRQNGLLARARRRGRGGAASVRACRAAGDPNAGWGGARGLPLNSIAALDFIERTRSSP